MSVSNAPEQPATTTPTNRLGKLRFPLFTTGSVSAGSSGQSQSLTYQQVQNIWISAGGNPQASSMAAAVADATSGLNPNAIRNLPNGQQAIGLWGLPKNGQPPGSTDPTANARAAIQLSSNGTDWSQWCVTWSDNNCGLNGGSYLGSGSNALGALASTGTYSVAGSTPAGNGTGASSATSTSPSTATSHSNLLLILLLAGGGVLLFFALRRRTDEMTGGAGGPAEQGGGGEVTVRPHVRHRPTS